MNSVKAETTKEQLRVVLRFESRLSSVSGSVTKRLFDIVLALLSTVTLLPLFVALGLLVKVTSKGPMLHWSPRVGRDNQLFRMPKLRSMKFDTPQIATHLLEDPDNHVTKIGRFLRKTSLDELPQLFNIIIGDLSFVGPRPALFNQHDLIEMRTEKGIQRLVPGLTGWAQVNGRDCLSIPEKVKLDFEYLQNRCFKLDMRILGMTMIKVLRREDVTH